MIVSGESSYPKEFVTCLNNRIIYIYIYINVIHGTRISLAVDGPTSFTLTWINANKKFCIRSVIKKKKKKTKKQQNSLCKLHIWRNANSSIFVFFVFIFDRTNIMSWNRLVIKLNIYSVAFVMRHTIIYFFVCLFSCFCYET